MGNKKELSNFYYEHELAKCTSFGDVTGKDGLNQKMIKNAWE